MEGFAIWREAYIRKKYLAYIKIREYNVQYNLVYIGIFCKFCRIQKLAI